MSSVSRNVLPRSRRSGAEASPMFRRAWASVRHGVVLEVPALASSPKREET